MFKSIALSLTGCAAASALTMSASAAPIDLVKYEFASLNANETGPGYEATVTSGLSATDIGDTSGVINTRIENLGYSSAPVLTVDGIATTSFSDAVYFSFTVTPDSGNTLNLDSLTLDAARGGGSRPRGFVVRSSADGFTTDLAVNPNTNTDLPTQRLIDFFTTYTVDLSDPAFDAVAGPLEFRIYVFSPGTGSAIDFDNITLHGEVVPEPASLALLGLGGLGFLRRRRHG
ncbi:MAG TPA: PEP-CTERM sorting domain-containing protein [Phycisphaeraceae bacterium]